MGILLGALLVMQAVTIVALWWLWKNIISVREQSESEIKKLYGIVHLQAEGSGSLTKLVGEIVQMLAPAKPPKPTGGSKVIPWKDNPA